MTSSNAHAKDEHTNARLQNKSQPPTIYNVKINTQTHYISLLIVVPILIPSTHLRLSPPHGNVVISKYQENEAHAGGFSLMHIAVLHTACRS